MTLAMVKVLPDPVTPRRTWLASPFSRLPSTSSRIACRLVAGGLIVGDELERPAAFRLVRARGLVRDEGSARLGFRQRCPDLNRHQDLYGRTHGANNWRTLLAVPAKARPPRSAPELQQQGPTTAASAAGHH